MTFTDDQSRSPVDILFYCYCIAAPVDTDQVRKAEQELGELISELPLKSSDALFDRISELCLACQKAAFLDGLQAGAELSRVLFP